MVAKKNIFIWKNENMNCWKKFKKTVVSKICIYLVKNESQYNMKIFRKVIFYNMALTKSLKYLLLIHYNSCHKKEDGVHRKWVACMPHSPR